MELGARPSPRRHDRERKDLYRLRIEIRHPGVLVEGWNIGWDGDWAGNGSAMQFATPAEDFDADYLAKYAKSKGVSLIGHHETGGAVSHYESQFDPAFKFAADHGEHVVKTGYVADAGQIERVNADGSVAREWHEGQWMVNHHLRVLEAAAKYKVSIDSHEPVKDTGLRRTYPNWLAREGSRGMEYNAWRARTRPSMRSTWPSPGCSKAQWTSRPACSA